MKRSVFDNDVLRSVLLASLQFPVNVAQISNERNTSSLWYNETLRHFRRQTSEIASMFRVSFQNLPAVDAGLCVMIILINFFRGIFINDLVVYYQILLELSQKEKYICICILCIYIYYSLSYFFNCSFNYLFIFMNEKKERETIAFKIKIR